MEMLLAGAGEPYEEASPPTGLTSPTRDLVSDQFLPHHAAGILSASKRSADGYSIEFAVPASALDVFRGEKLDALRIELSVADFDGSDKSGIGQSTLWWRPSRFSPKAIPASGSFRRPQARRPGRLRGDSRTDVCGQASTQASGALRCCTGGSSRCSRTLELTEPWGPGAMDRHIAVWGLSERIENALHATAARQSVEVRDALQASQPVALLLRAPSTASARSGFERVAAQHRGCPIVLLQLSRHEAQPYLHAHAVVSAAGDSATTASRLLRAALEAADEYKLSLVGGSPAMRGLRADLRLGASAPSTVLLLGDTGTGKGLAARALHELSSRAREPFETVDCAGLAPSLIESELFGHERGAFTGAYERHIGKLERAACGTLFLDEIGELDVGLQTRLLRALEERVFERVGGSALLPLRARVVAATHRDLWADVATGRFRRDLLYRLDVLRIRVPGLVERVDDIPLLVDHLLIRAARRLERPVPRAGQELIEVLQEQHWAGNVRELANLLESILVRSNGDTLGASALAPRSIPGTAFDEHGELSALLVECGGNVARVARRLGKPRSTVRSRISRLGLDRLLPRD